MLAAKGQEMEAGRTHIFKLPVTDINGNRRFMVEKGSLCDSLRYPLLASNKRNISLGVSGIPDAIEAKDKNGNSFWAQVNRTGELPVLTIGHACTAALKCKGSTSPAEVKLMGPDEKSKMLNTLHNRLAHATGRRLYLTLKEKRWGGHI